MCNRFSLSSQHILCLTSQRCSPYRARLEPDLLCVSEELLPYDLDANDYAILLNSKLEILLDKHAPVNKRSVRVGQHPNNQLSNEAIVAEKRCRRMERLHKEPVLPNKLTNLQRKLPGRPSLILRRLPSRRSSAPMLIHVPCGAHFTESCIVTRNSITLNAECQSLVT